VDYPNAAEFCKLLAAVNVDAFMINTDEIEYGGSLEDLKSCAKAMKAFNPLKAPACIQKDLIIHPIQVKLFSNLKSPYPSITLISHQYWI
jgi:indole-3-glycerol phosphate synthase